MAHLLVIEPDHVLAEIYAATLKANGHSITACATAQAGILAADERRPDLIVLELQLVEHSGIEFLYELRSYPDWQRIPVLVHSQVPVGEFKSSLGLLQDELGVVEYLYKPAVSLHRLTRTVNQYLPVVA